MTLRTWRALVVDDNAINLEVAVGLLVQMGVQTDSATEGTQAVALALNHDYDLIVMDVQMPHMDGMAATRRIRQARGRRPAIIALTANANADDRDACMAAGMDDYLTKPVTVPQLESALQRWLAGWVAPAEEPAGRAPAPLPAAANAGSAAPHDKLAAIAGFDLAGSLQNLGGQMPRLERVLLRFATTYRAGEPALMQAARRADTPALWQICHSLRGACAVLCATALVQQIEALEAALVTPQPDITLLEKVRPLQAELVALARQLEAALGPA
jgi:CheY-like chemotaxis protein/HPt (histidine-containing phosphotransfer) domain-containing protein